MEKKILDLLMEVRPKGIEVEAYPFVMELIVSLVRLELTKNG
jgi:hypothetical protein